MRVANQSVRRAALAMGTLCYLLAALILGLIVIRSSDSEVNPAVPALGLTAVLVVSIAFFAPGLLRQFSISVRPWLTFVIAGFSALLSLGPWLLVQLSHESAATAVYQGLRIPQGPVQFWDLNLVLQSVDCAQAGVDIYVINNGCLQDPSIYAPGTLWLQYAPLDIFSAKNSGWLGLLALVVSTLMVLWLARNSTSRGQLALLVSIFGAGWLLILERGNFDLFVMWVAVLTVILVRRFPSLWTWSIAAALIWLAGTWKYYPFVLGVMLIPLLFIRRGWLVLSGFVIATGIFVAMTWDNVLLSLNANAGMVDLGDFVVLGRVPLVARMLGGDGESSTFGAPDLLVFLLALAAVVWGVVWVFGWGRLGEIDSRSSYPAMLAAGGSALFLISVLVSGFGYAYKAAFLLLLIPFLSRPVRGRDPHVFVPCIIVLMLIAISSVVVWNTALATVSGIIAAAFALGAAGTVLKKPFLVTIAREIAPEGRDYRFTNPLDSSSPE